MAVPNVASLPVNIVSRSDLIRLLIEVDQLDETYNQASLRSKVTTGEQPTPLYMSESLRQFIDVYTSNATTRDGRQQLHQQIELLAQQSPQLHISFASEPPLAQLRTLVMWFRQNIHTTALIQVSVQPAIVAGCVVRSSSRVFDMSLRRAFDAATPQLAKEVQSI